MAKVKSVPSKKRTSRKKSAAASKAIRLQIELGPVKANKDQLDRLKAHLSNQVLTWVKADVKNKTAPPIVAEEWPLPPRNADENDRY